MIKEDCDHEWHKNRVGKYVCSKCGEWELASNVFQRESLANQVKQNKFKQWLQIIIAILKAIITSIISLFK